MKNIMKKGLRFSALFAMSALLLASCNDWTEYESLDIETPTMDEGLYADYVKNLKAYKAGAHKVAMASLENTANGPVRQSERLTALPDSLDFIVLNNPDNLSNGYLGEMKEVRAKGTRVIYAIDYASVESEWAAMLKAEASLTEEQALAYIADRTNELLSLHDKYGYDGVIFTYAGRSQAGMTETELAQYSARQQAYVNAVSAWRQSHTATVFAFKGRAQYLLAESKALLADCDYIILETTSASNTADMTIAANAALDSGDVPSDRFLITVETTRYDDDDMIYGYLGTVDASGEPERSIRSGAVWTGQPSDFTRAGMLILNAQYDYFDNTPIYFHLREAIDIMNPSPKK